MGTAGSASGPGKRAGGNTGTAPRADSTMSAMAVPEGALAELQLLLKV